MKIIITRGGEPYAMARGGNILEDITIDEQSFPNYAAKMLLKEFGLVPLGLSNNPQELADQMREFRAWKDQVAYACNVACTNKNTGKSFDTMWQDNMDANKGKPWADAYKLNEVLADKPLVLAVPGPSLKKFAPSLRSTKAPILAIARALKTIPWADLCISLDAKPVIKDQFAEANCCSASIMDITTDPGVWDTQQRVFTYCGCGLENDLNFVDVIPCMTVLATAIQLVAVFRCSPVYIIGADIYGQDPKRYYEPVTCVDGKQRMAPLDYLHVSRFVESVALGAKMQGLDWYYLTDKGYAWNNIKRARYLPKFNETGYRQSIIDCWRRNLNG